MSEIAEVEYVNPLNELSFQQEQFVLAYMANGGRAPDAAREAGYASPEIQGYRVVNTPRVRNAIEALRAERRAAIDLKLRKKHLTPDRILEELATIAGFDLGEVLVQGPDGPRLDVTRLKSRHTRALQAIETERTSSATTKTKIKVYDKLAALRLLMDHLGMLKASTVAVQVNVDFGERMAARRARALEGR